RRRPLFFLLFLTLFFELFLALPFFPAAFFAAFFAPPFFFGGGLLAPLPPPPLAALGGLAAFRSPQDALRARAPPEGRPPCSPAPSSSLSVPAAASPMSDMPDPASSWSGIPIL